MVGCVNVWHEESCEGFDRGAPREEQILDLPVSKQNLISPQKVQLEMRPNEKYSINFEVRKDENDVDIYFLLDNTYSMERFKKQLSKIADILGNKISKYTSKYRFGFGAFDEKSTPPFSAKEENPKNFVHYLDLTNDTAKFSKEVDESSILPKNVLNDSPEAGLDGLVQVINCKDIIGWREDTMHLIIYISDGPFHFAGDGIYAGIWRPYNSSCQLEWDSSIGRYIYQGLRYDYPSLSQTNYWLHKENKHLIFGVTKHLLRLYNSLNEEGVLASSTGDIGDGTGKDIHELVINEFKTIANKLSIEYLKTTSDLPDVTEEKSLIDVKIRQIGKRNRVEKNNNTFTLHGVNVNEVYDLQAELRMDENVCKEKANKIIVDIKLAGHKGHHLEVEVSPMCECDCQSDQPSTNTTHCHCHGTLACGQCTCDPGYKGEFCQCKEEDKFCRAEKLHKNCNRQGYFRCGQCVCLEGFVGQSCEHTACQDHNTTACTDPFTQVCIF